MNIAEKYSRQASSTIGESSNPPKDSAPQTPPVAPQSTVTQSSEPRKRRNGALWGIVSVLVLILMAVTCPSKEDHQEQISKVFREYMNGQIEDRSNPVVAVGSWLAGGLVDYAIDNMVTVDKYLIFSVGTMNYLDGEKERISFGVFGKVFTFDVDDLAEGLSEDE